MLIELRVKDFGIIEEINWELEPGLNVITGETGAGKSLVIDAVEALLAGRTDADVIRHGANEAHVEGIVSLPRDEGMHRVREILCDNGLDSDDEILVINCEFRRQGRGIFRVNRKATPKSILQQIGRFLIDIHGQSQHLSLLDNEYQLDFLDSYAQAVEKRRGFSAKAVELIRIEHELRTAIEAEKDSARQEEYLTYQINEIRQAELKEGEEEDLERDRTVLTSIEKLKAHSYEACKALYGEETYSQSESALDKVNEAIKAMRKLVEMDSSLKQELDYLEGVVQGVEEVARDVSSYGERLEYDPGRLEAVEVRSQLIGSLKKKYGQSITQVLEYLQESEKHLEEITHSMEKRAALEEECRALKSEMGVMAYDLSRARTEAVGSLVTRVKAELKDLNMSQVDFQVSLEQELSEEGLPFPDGECYAFTKDGADRVEFMVSTNPGEPLKPLAKIASTGEISRFMLALKGSLSRADNIPVLIFDEIDIGIGGRSGEIIGKKLWALAQNRQVICVTHLPQIAAFADAHFAVHKTVAGERTVSVLEALRDESREREIAAMLAGPQLTEAYLHGANELLQKAAEWKESYGGVG